MYGINIRGQPMMGGSPAWGLGKGFNISLP